MPGGAAQPWLPLHALTLRYLEAPQSARAGEAATVVVEAVAEGAVATQLPELELGSSAGVQVFAEAPQVDESFDNGRLRSRVVRRFSIVPARAGALRIPGPRIAWWDVRAGLARSASLPDLWLLVAGGAPGFGAAAPVPADAPAIDAAGQRRTGGEVAAWPWIALAFALLWLGTLAWALWRRGAMPTRVRTSGTARTAFAPAESRSSQRQLKQALQAGDLGEVAGILCAMPVPPAPDLDALVMRIDDATQRDAIAVLQRARWGEGDAATARAALREAFKSGPRWMPLEERASDGLPPLYPRTKAH
jgi:hypothetical protein